MASGAATECACLLLATTSRPSLTQALSHCTGLTELYLCYCLPDSMSSKSAYEPQTASWLYETLSSIASRKLRYLSIRLDARLLATNLSTNHLYKLAKEFFAEQNATRIDAFLSNSTRFKRLRIVRFGLLCGTQTQSPDKNVWMAVITSSFPQLQARHMLG